MIYDLCLLGYGAALLQMYLEELFHWRGPTHLLVLTVNLTLFVVVKQVARSCYKVSTTLVILSLLIPIAALFP